VDMHLKGSKPYLLNLTLVFSGYLSPGTLASSARSSSLQPSVPDHGATIPKPVFLVADETPLQKRVDGYQYLGDGFRLTYKTFTPFPPNWPVALTLSMFWTEIAIQISNVAWMPDDQFGGNTFKLRMPLGQDALMDLVFEVVSFEGPVSRELVVRVATAMMGYTLRGSCGVFNAWLRQRGGRGGIWIVLRLRGLAERSTLTPGAA